MRAARRCIVLLAALLAACAQHIDPPSAEFGRALNAAKAAQRLQPADRDDGLRPLARELPAGAARPATPAGAAPAGLTMPPGVVVVPSAGVR